MPTYQNPIPVAVCVVAVYHEGKLSLVGIRRNIEPAKGFLALPGGYVDQGESAQVAAAREMREETTFDSEPSGWRVVDTATNDANRMLIFCVYSRTLSQDEFARLTPGDPREVASIEQLDPATARDPEKVPFSLHREYMTRFFSQHPESSG